MLELVAANAAFVGTHFAMSHPLRPAMTKALGERRFQSVYSIISLATFAWVYFAFKAAPPADLGGSGEIGWIIATALTLPAMILFAESVLGKNPALPTPTAEQDARAEPRGVFTITRQPMMWGFGLWALSHMVMFWSTRTMITAFAMGILAIVGAKMQDAKKRDLMGEAWHVWESNTSFWPRLSGFAKAGVVPWGLGLALFAGLSYLHIPMGGIPAGIWRYIAL